ncbi:hypothetical protein [Paractinoplanes atraurantiacus]|uniref:Integral membrane protein n=1 Tax=Paractinoplanes atraurantiacus TaxID=1036182 RepID=A0A285I2W2_9ACTN|nr:hypothetical protein [Actinoplanes atraurantiacus]SNY42284.1 hypothetical protein SAMN05421748_106272 [Actinoplanes atraurantiacus]
MSTGVAVLLLLAGLSEALGRVLPVVARRSGASPSAAGGLLLFGAVVDATVFALWPLTAGALAGLAPGDAVRLWTPGLVAPLLLAAVLAFPLLGPLLHFLLLVGVGAGLTGALSAATGDGWWTAAGSVAVSGAGLALAVEAVRRAVARITRVAAGEALA